MFHCGWRGLADGLIAEGVRALRELGAAGELGAAIGPGAGPCCYEVGDEVRDAFTSLGDGIASGRLLVVTRAVSATGLEKGLAEAVQTRNGGLELKKLASLPLGPTANVEGITAEPRPGGGTRLWLVTDNDFRPRAPTLLVALDLP